MKFENPKMTISMFEVENVVTNGSDPTTPTGYTGDKKTVTNLFADTKDAATNVLEFNF